MSIRRFFLLVVSMALLAFLPGASMALAAGAETIAVVVDYGMGQGPQVICTTLPPGSTDASALAYAMTQEGQPVPTYNNSGLLCTIGGFPSTGCGTRSPSGYSYWAYFHGTTSGWTYANNGPTEQQASPQTTEGWRFESNGSGGASDQVPGSSANSLQLCPAISATTLPGATSQGTPAETPATSQGTSVAPPTTSSHATSSLSPSAISVPPATGKISSETPAKKRSLDSKTGLALGGIQESVSPSPWPVFIVIGGVILSVIGTVIWRRRTT